MGPTFIVHSQCMPFGSELMIASVLGSASCSSYDPYQRSMLCFFAVASAFAASRDEIDTISEFFEPYEAGRWAFRPTCAVESNP